MDAAVKRQDSQSLDALMLGIGEAARSAAHALATASEETKNAALRKMADAVVARTDEILAVNAEDGRAAKESGMEDAFVDRLTLTEDRIAGMAKGLRDIAALADPVGQEMASWERPNGLQISRVRVPLGVIGIIYESRPNVTSDAGGLSLKSGNAVILRGGSNALATSQAIHGALVEGLTAAGLPEAAIQLVPVTDRAAVGMMLGGLNGSVDVIVPRGGKSLVARVQEEARVPVFAHLEGICHVYVERSADLQMAKDIVLNAKMRRTGICGAAETVLVDRAIAETHLKPLIEILIDAGCEVRGDEAVQQEDDRVIAATEADWLTEYLAPVVAMKVVADQREAMDHIAAYGSQHTDAIVSGDQAAADRFLTQVDSAIVLHNASTQFADGGEFGMGAEIGIATGRFHARGPVGVEQLTTFKYVVRGSGQTRP
ncbi:Gamma-glutamyl phosphate reductase [Methyloligella halotolerans]|uniref:Gamma-glutamyl phosphate reductase n=1 Tax=Methyloligella halotolerans TaxID=1177755 RepID=A0A1E2S100_9HYPH|nr:glutamate-5-semialdehyde dehydrogenase [Methyloligella halotolerans]ODA68134.1 Gamma-glutamyl phosphate reductase [Methyloligella halotolerans]